MAPGHAGGRPSGRPRLISLAIALALATLLLLLAAERAQAVDEWSVDQEADTNGSGLCTTAPADCSLRDAMALAATGGANVLIDLPPGHYELTSTPPLPDVGA